MGTDKLCSSVGSCSYLFQ